MSPEETIARTAIRQYQREVDLEERARLLQARVALRNRSGRFVEACARLLGVREADLRAFIESQNPYIEPDVFEGPTVDEGFCRAVVDRAWEGPGLCGRSGTHGIPGKLSVCFQHMDALLTHEARRLPCFCDIYIPDRD